MKKKAHARLACAFFFFTKDDKKKSLRSSLVKKKNVHARFSPRMIKKNLWNFFFSFLGNLSTKHTRNTTAVFRKNQHHDQDHAPQQGVQHPWPHDGS